MIQNGSRLVNLSFVFFRKMLAPLGCFIYTNGVLHTIELEPFLGLV
jgi:hypothetical protein